MSMCTRKGASALAAALVFGPAVAAPAGEARVGGVEPRRSPAFFVTGAVVDGDGAPVAGAELRAREQDVEVAFTGADGAYRLGPGS